MIYSTRLLSIYVIQRILISRSISTSIYSPTIVIHLYLHQNLTLTFLLILVSLKDILRFPKITPFCVVFTNISLMEIHHSLSRIVYKRTFLTYVVVSLNYNVLALSSDQDFGWNA